MADAKAIAYPSTVPSNARHIMSMVMQHEAYVLTINGFRMIRRPAFGDGARNRLEAFRLQIMRRYRQAFQRTLATLTPTDRLRIAFAELSPRQLEVCSWIASGKSNEDIATIIDVGVDTAKAHVKAIHAKVGADGRLAIAVIAHTIPPFARMPPLWRIGEDVWAGAARRERNRPRRAS